MNTQIKNTGIKRFINKLMNEYRSFVNLAIILLFASIISSDFLSLTNIFNVIRQVSIIAILACGMTFVILTGGIDLSVGSILGLSGALSAGTLTFVSNATSNPALAITAAILCALVVGTACGLFNGLFITKGSLPPFIVTLATLTLLSGLLLVYTNGAPIRVSDSSYMFIGKGSLLGIPFPIWLLIFVYAVAFFVLQYTTFGRQIYAIGGNKEASRLSGINTNKIETLAYALNGFLAGLGGIILTARLGAAQPTAGSGFELDSIAAVILGGTSLSGGQGFVLPTVVGAVILGVLDNILVLMNVNPFVSDIVKGAVILIAVLIDRKFKNISTKIEG